MKKVKMKMKIKYMIFDTIKKWFDKEEAEEIIEELAVVEAPVIPPPAEPTPEKPQTYSFM